jgi:signal transduction histidine kinase
MYLEHTAKDTGWTWKVIDELEQEPVPEARVACYRIAQEAVANVRKHANATHVGVRLSSAEGGLLLRIEDDGDGFDPNETPLPGHLGLVTVTERAELAGGWCRIESRLGEDSVLECWMPLAAPVEAP